MQQLKVGSGRGSHVLATGSELVAAINQPGKENADPPIRITFYWQLASLSGAVVEPLPLAGDDIALLKQQIKEAAERTDVVINSGGVSMGVSDFTKAALVDLGCEIFSNASRSAG